MCKASRPEKGTLTEAASEMARLSNQLNIPGTGFPMDCILNPFGGGIPGIDVLPDFARALSC